MDSARGLVFDGLTMCFGLWMAAAVSGRIVEGASVRMAQRFVLVGNFWSEA